MKLEGNINVPCQIHWYSDDSYAGDKKTWKNVTGYLILTNGVEIAYHFKTHETITLSVTEYEYSSVTVVCPEILFICTILFFVVVVVEYHIYVHIDNVWAIFLS